MAGLAHSHDHRIRHHLRAASEAQGREGWAVLHEADKGLLLDLGTAGEGQVLEAAGEAGPGHELERRVLHLKAAHEVQVLDGQITRPQRLQSLVAEIALHAVGDEVHAAEVQVPQLRAVRGDEAHADIGHPFHVSQVQVFQVHAILSDGPHLRGTSDGEKKRRATGVWV